ncbi:MAG TPA: pyridoxamine 5'-phosphate oxidase family protein [Burkholderiales bacterium]|nr:pyridoxamine 5'-phosphate oxidase family protein [Burkholderiales bacterium]
MGVKLTDEEINEFLTKGHTLILGTLRKSGEPFMTPLWYVYKDGSFYTGTLAKSAKVGHIRRDPRVCCMVEEGEAWVDLHVVVANCTATIIEDPSSVPWVQEAMDAKYAAFRPDRSKQPDATKKHYGGGRVIIKATPKPGEIRSWYNRKIRMAS